MSIGTIKTRRTKVAATALTLTMLASTFITGLTGPLASEASAAPIVDATELSLSPDLTWDVDVRSGRARHTGTYQTLIWDLQELNGVMYAGGDFTQVVAPDGTRTAHSFIAAFDLETGVWISSFQPDVDGLVYSLGVTDDGKLIAGGEFDGGVVLLDPITGDAVPGFDASLDHSWGNAAVFTVASSGDDIYAGGRFVRGNDIAGSEVAVDNLAKLDASTGAVDPGWAPTVEPVFYGDRLSERVQDIEIDPVRGRVYVGGLFASVNDDATSGSFAILDPETGTSIAGRPVVDNPVIFVYDIALDGDLIHYGGKENFTITVDADTFVRQTDILYTNNGDHQVITPGANTLWVGCHCWRSAFTAPPPQNPFAAPADATPVNAVIAIDRASGNVLPITLDLRGAAGSWDIVEDSNGRLWVGGQFTRGGDRRLNGLARFSVQQDPAAALTSCVVERDGNQALVSWEGSGEQVGADRYVIRRSVDGGSIYWRGRTNADARSLTDSDRLGAVSYAVEARVGQTLVGPLACTEIIVGTPTPTDLRAARVTRERVVLNWSASGEVEISRDGVIIATDADGWFTDRSVDSATTYTYEVRYTGAVDAAPAISVTTN